METLSIIIPTLNEADHITETIFALRKNAASRCQKQIIVVDGGSLDTTREIACHLNVQVLYQPLAPRGRAHLLNKGVQVAHGEYLLFLDADSIVPRGYDADILNTLNREDVVGGAFEFTLEGSAFGLRVVEFINRTRYRIWKRYYGDQGIFVRKGIFNKVGGYPPIGLMEASEFCLNLAKEGRLKLVHKPLLTSARRFLENGIYRVLGFDIKMWWLNLFGRDVEPFARAYWSVNEQ